ncbi:unnamed protein product [Owenia fusiformis]|uniref:Uncharacterized protein n=1 Tax=Owenia fusiformis TaxID=6347 RepID=A0A8J1TV66_OWEFU|nr:unnamed protein product [Owenia fusiformis]
MPSDYEKLRLQNIADNKKILAQLGLLNPFKPLPRVIKKAPKRKRLPSPQKPEKKLALEAAGENLENLGSVRGVSRRSCRIQGKAPLSKDEISAAVKEEIVHEPPRKCPPKREHVFGHIPGVEIGTVWQLRVDCCYAGVHRPTVAGISGNPQEGAYSVALSGGYEDDIDMGDCFTFTGSGGRDLKGTSNNPKNLRTAPQSKDQTLDRVNLALYQNVENKRPVRVIRGYKLHSPFAPEEGYRYDGLYQVEKAWFTTGMSGFGVWKFAFRRLKDQPPPPWTIVDTKSEPGDDVPDSQDSGVADLKSDPGSSRSASPSVDSLFGSNNSDTPSSQGNEVKDHLQGELADPKDKPESSSVLTEPTNKDEKEDPESNEGIDLNSNEKSAIEPNEETNGTSDKAELASKDQGSEKSVQECDGLQLFCDGS